MRAGGFAERRVIDLFNRRFVAYYFNRSGMGEGGSQAATDFVNGQTENPYAYLAAFAPDGKIVGETELYADKDAVFDWARKLLDDHPDYDAEPTSEALVRTAAGEGSSVEERLAKCRLDEELGLYDAAKRGYGEVAALAGSPASATLSAQLGLLRIHRYEQDWKAHEALEFKAREGKGASPGHVIELDIERGRRFVAQKQYAPAREWLQALSRRSVGHPRNAEAHYYAGVACWFTGDRPWAKFHWCWVQENLPHDRLARRAYIAAAAEAMPYANAELGGYKAPVGNIGTRDIIRGYRDALEVYRSLAPRFGAGENEGGTASNAQGATPVDASSAAVAASPQGPEDASALVAHFRDDELKLDQELVEKLAAIGDPSIAALLALVEDPEFAGRGKAAFTLGLLLARLENPPADAVQALEAAAASDEEGPLKSLAKAGLDRVRQAEEKRAVVPEEEQGPDTTSPLLLVALLKDGNASVPANNVIVDRLEKLGEAAIPSLIAAVKDNDFPGRGYAGWALSQVLKANKIDDPAAMAALRQALQDSNPYVRTLAGSGLSSLRR